MRAVNRPLKILLRNHLEREPRARRVLQSFMKNAIRANRGFIAFLLCLGLVRTAVADWNPVPTGSMRPTILEGDVVLVNKLAYDVKLPLTDHSLGRTGEPVRGDIVVFRSPQDNKRLVKRLVAVAGDVVEMRRDRLFINGQSADYVVQQVLDDPVQGQMLKAVRLRESIAGETRTIQLLPDVNSLRSFGPLTVPEDHYFFMGDSRNNSADSRYFGFVSRDLLIGRAHHILVSADILGNWSPQFGRFGQALD